MLEKHLIELEILPEENSKEVSFDFALITNEVFEIDKRQIDGSYSTEIIRKDTHVAIVPIGDT